SSARSSTRRCWAAPSVIARRWRGWLARRSGGRSLVGCGTARRAAIGPPAFPPPNGFLHALTPCGVMLSSLPNGGRESFGMRARSIRDFAAAVRGRRRDLGMSQAELAAHAGVSRKWIYEFEAGKPNAELGLILRVVDALGLQL